MKLNPFIFDPECIIGFQSNWNARVMPNLMAPSQG